MTVILGFILSHWLHALIGGGVTAALGLGLRALGWPFIAKYWADIVGFLCLILVVVLTLILYVKLKDEEALAAKYAANFKIIQGQAETLNADNQNLVAQLKAQSDSINQAAQDALVVEANAKLALAAAKAKQNADAATINKLQARAANNEGSCDDEIAFLRSSM
jgi:hypothetical protein